VNEAQKRRIASTFEHVDELLQSAVSATRGDATRSPFNHFILDATPDQQRKIEAEVQKTREQMVAAMDRLGIPQATPSVLATRSIQTDLLFAEVDIEDIEPRRLRGYGVLNPEDIGMLDDVTANLLTALRRVRACLEDASE